MVFLTTWRDMKSQDSALYVLRISATMEERWGIVPSIIFCFADQCFPIGVSWRICAIAHNFENFSKGFFCILFHMRYIFFMFSFIFYIFKTISQFYFFLSNHGFLSLYLRKYLLIFYPMTFYRNHFIRSKKRNFLLACVFHAFI